MSKDSTIPSALGPVDTMPSKLGPAEGLPRRRPGEPARRLPRMLWLAALAVAVALISRFFPT